jgi:hypothetical protein
MLAFASEKLKSETSRFGGTVGPLAILIKIGALTTEDSCAAEHIAAKTETSTNKPGKILFMSFGSFFKNILFSRIRKVIEEQ